MGDRFRRMFAWLVLPPARGSTAGHLWPRWIFLRLLGVWFFSVFYSLWFQACGLIGPDGILPVSPYLTSVAQEHAGTSKYWAAGSLLWFGTSDHAILALCAFGGIASLLLVFNIAPRWSVACCTLAFLSFTETLQRFSSYQSDGMLLEAGLISIFFAPPGFRPRLAAANPPSRLSLFALQWLWFRIYFESGAVKWKGHDEQWRNLTAMDRYYENGPLPTWIAWYAQQKLPHAFHAATAFFTLLAEIVLAWFMFLPRAFRIGLCLLLTPFQLGIILTANYAFLNYLVLSLGLLGLDDRFLARFRLRVPEAVEGPRRRAWPTFEGIVLLTQLYATVTLMPFQELRFLPQQPAEILRQFRFANSYGLFGHMTRQRYEIEFEGTLDGETWRFYKFRYKPQNVNTPPGIYAPYQPRFEWNLWFAQLGDWRRNQWVADCEKKLLEGSPTVLALFKKDPFDGRKPLRVRAVRRSYRFSTPDEKAESGAWWQRGEAELYAPTLERSSDGSVQVIDTP